MSTKVKAETVSDEDMSGIIDDLKKTKNIHVDFSLLADDNSPCVVSEWMSTGCLALDTIMGGGAPVGRIVEIYGDNSTGKSLIAAQIASVAQQDGAVVVYVDTESAVSLKIMEAVGVDTKKLIYTAPDTVEEVFEFFEGVLESKKKRFPNKRILLIWDSIAATSVDQEMANVYGKATMGRHAQIISQSMRKFTRRISKEHVCCIFVNQTREKIGVMFGDNEATFGGKAMGFYASIRIRLKMGQKIKDGRRPIGIESRATIVKNKCAIPYLSAELPIYFGHGIDDALASYQYLKAGDMIDRKGKSYTIRDSGLPEFTMANWEDYYDKNYDAIADIITSMELSEEDGDDVSDEKDDEKDDEA
jgi:recombination protein RecA